MHPNVVGSTTVGTAANGAVSEDYLYYPWGQEWTVAGTATEYHFAGCQWHDWAANLEPTPFRNYASTEVRRLSPDPLGGDVTNPQSLNRYAYVMNNPTTLTDPLGLDATDCTQATMSDGTQGYGCSGPDSVAVVASAGGMSFGGGLGGDVPPPYLIFRPGWGSGGGGDGGNSAPPPNVITWPQLQQVVRQNNRSLFACDELVDCIVFNESSTKGGFNTSAVPTGAQLSTARGLMQVTKPATADVAGAPLHSGATSDLYNQLFDPATNIQVGTQYLDILYVRFGGDWQTALAHYGTGAGYADDILNFVEDLFLGNNAGAMEAAYGH